jgi:hypothetical protein
MTKARAKARNKSKSEPESRSKQGPASEPSSDDVSPLAPHTLMMHYPHLLICEDNRDELRELLRQTGIRVVTWHHTSGPFCDLERGEVQVGWPYAERLWAHVCAYLTVLEWYENAGRPQSLETFVLDTQFAGVLRLHRWALLGANTSSRIAWPADTPRPLGPSRIPYGFQQLEEFAAKNLVDSFEGRVTRVFQRAIAWMILHELRHLLGGHVAPANIAIPWRTMNSMMQEQEADHWAALWSQTAHGDRREFDRFSLLGLIAAFATLISAVLMPFNRTIERRTHADPPTRLRRFLKTFQQEGDLGWTAASVFLEFELWAQKMPTAASEQFGTDVHLCRFFENIGGHVV